MKLLDASLIWNGQQIELTKNELKILQTLMEHKEKIVSREELMEKVGGFEYYGDLRTVDVAIRRLREKVEDDPAQPKYIITRRGAGYYFQQEP